MPMQLQLIAPDTRMEASADGASFNISESATRTFLCRLTVTDQIEQESLDVSIWGSADGQTWPKKPLLKLPQQFYRGTTKLVLDLSLRPEVKFIRARWDLNRWGRVRGARKKVPLEMFEECNSEPKFYVNCAISGASGLFKGRRLTVGCPVVVSLLPREWYCLYRRGQPPISFLLG